MRLIFLLVYISSLFHTVQTKPALDEERRNLCEGEPNLAECIKEVEEAKSTPMTVLTDTEDTSKNANKNDDNSSKNDDNTNKNDGNMAKKDNKPEVDKYHEKMMEQEALIRRMVEDSEQNRAYWDEEYKSMNKWARYGLA